MQSRRLFLKASLATACSAAAHPFLTTATFAALPGDNRLVVIILRGAMDGLDVLQPWGDAALRALRPTLSAGPAGGATDLDGFYALHPALAPLLPLWQAGELGFAQAVSTPYRNKRSHFDGQDILEAGTGPDLPPALQRSGWLNRLLQVLPGARAETAFSVGAQELLLLSGAAPSMAWSPEAELTLGPQGRALFEQIYAQDALFREAGAEAMAISAGMGLSPMDAVRGATAEAEALAAFSAARLLGETRLAAFSLTGWDTHRGQGAALAAAQSRLGAAILRLRADLGAVWGRTTVLAMTEFGRTARENGTQGTDHGTGGAMLMAGGAIRGGRVFGKWPGLGESDLFDGRDLLPTGDVRAYAGWAMAGLFGVERGQIESSIFPGLQLGENPGLLL